MKFNLSPKNWGTNIAEAGAAKAVNEANVQALERAEVEQKLATFEIPEAFANAVGEVATLAEDLPAGLEVKKSASSAEKATAASDIDALLSGASIPEGAM